MIFLSTFCWERHTQTSVECKKCSVVSQISTFLSICSLCRSSAPHLASRLDPPPYLDGSLAGDFGFDPLGLGEDPDSLKWYVQAELVHARFANGRRCRDSFHRRISSLPVWYEAGAVKYQFVNTETLFVETERYMNFTSPGSQSKEGSFFGLEAALEGLEPGYPGGLLLNSLGLAKDIKNGHLATMAMFGIFVQASVTHVGPLNNFIEHRSDPWHKTIIQTLAGTTSLTLSIT
ncbi:Chlorophyll A-B binding protein [Dillenia turbinata]|uniref:Chlorophyll a-b binding protein, chloroplastic n=1 Tax=Dillenia turbinata TaxID=194707 RepID=A0AAN8VZL9_9MAGN